MILLTVCTWAILQTGVPCKVEQEFNSLGACQQEMTKQGVGNAPSAAISGTTIDEIGIIHLKEDGKTWFCSEYEGKLS